jgi:ribose-phosphate pyrophosphokinase
VLTSVPPAPPDADRATDPSAMTVVLGPSEAFRRGDIGPEIATVTARREIFPDGEQLVSLPADTDLTGRDVLVVHSTGAPQDASFLSLWQLLDVVNRLGARRVTCFVPYLGYQRQDQCTRPGEPCSAESVLTLTAAAGAHELITVDRHSLRPGVDGLPIRDLPAATAFAERPPQWLREVTAVVSPDAGGNARAAAVARILGLPLVTLEKHKKDGRTFYDLVDPGVAGGNCLVVEDVCSSGSTLLPLRDALTGAGARMSVFVSHLLAGRARITERLGPHVRVATSDSLGDAAAEVRLLPLVLAAWRELSGPADRGERLQWVR